VLTTLLPQIIQDLNLETISDASHLVIAFLVPYCTGIIAFVGIGQLIGWRRALFCALGTYIVGAVFASQYVILEPVAAEFMKTLPMDTSQLSTELIALVLARVISALGAGGSTGIALAVVTDMRWGLSLNERARAVAMLSTAEVASYVVGGIWGAAVIQVLPWNVTFLIHAALILIILGFIVATFPQTEPQQNITWFRLLTITVLLTMSISGLVYSILSLPESITEPVNYIKIMGGIGLSLASLVSLLVALKGSALLSHLKTSQRQVIGVGFVTNVIVGLLLFIPLILLPIAVAMDQVSLFTEWLLPRCPAWMPCPQADVSGTAGLTGLMVAAYAVPLAMATAISGVLVNRFGQKVTVLIAFGAFALATLLVTQTMIRPINYVWMALASCVIGTSIGCSLVASALVIVSGDSDLDPGQKATLVLLGRLLGAVLSMTLFTWLGDYLTSQQLYRIVGERILSAEPLNYIESFPRAYVQSIDVMLSQVLLGAAGLAILSALCAWFLLPSDDTTSTHSPHLTTQPQGDLA